MKILIVEDCERDSELIARELRKQLSSVEMTRVETPEAFAAALAGAAWDVIISDHQLPRFSSSAALEALKASGQDIPFIVVSGKMGEDFAVASMRAGAKDYVFKRDLTRLAPAVEREVREAQVRRGAQAALRATQDRLQRLLATSNEGIWMVDAGGRTEFANARAMEILGFASPEEILGRSGDARASERSDDVRREVRLTRPDGPDVRLAVSQTVLRDGGGAVTGSLSVFMDVTAQRRAQEELEQAHKLEAVGRLASGIAHEINTPIQYIGDNTTFLSEAFTALATVVERQRSALAEVAPAAVRERLEREVRDLDVNDLLDQVPRTIGRTLEGVRRVATIVKAMKEFAHPDQPEMRTADLNRIILATLEVSRNEYKYVAEVTTDLGELPPVCCHPGELSQVFLNILVNAAHAIEDVVKGTSAKGTIGVRTRREGDEVAVAISDTGGGIAPAIQEKIFDPFFTTKEVGRGTGQGLAIARNIVKKHRGSIDFTTEAGRGTTFLVRVPIEHRSRPAERPG